MDSPKPEPQKLVECPRCHESTYVVLVAVSADAEAPRDVFTCMQCDHDFEA